MKDILITSRQFRREGRLLLACLLVAFLLNIYSILAYDTSWVELVTTLHYTIALTLVLYVVLGLVRLIARGIRRLTARKQPELADG